MSKKMFNWFIRRLQQRTVSDHTHSSGVERKSLDAFACYTRPAVMTRMMISMLYIIRSDGNLVEAIMVHAHCRPGERREKCWESMHCCILNKNIKYTLHHQLCNITSIAEDQVTVIHSFWRGETFYMPLIFSPPTSPAVPYQARESHPAERKQPSHSTTQ